jgi:DNA-binding response OmpR family regulator
MKYKILIIEDETLLLDVYKESLSGPEFKVDTAVDGNQAWEKLSQGGYDLVLLDVILPEKDGLQLLQQLKKNPPKKPNKKIVFMTNLAEESLIKQAKGLGVDQVMVKSDITPDEFVEKVRGYLGSSK